VFFLKEALQKVEIASIRTHGILFKKNPNCKLIQPWIFNIILEWVWNRNLIFKHTTTLTGSDVLSLAFERPPRTVPSLVQHNFSVFFNGSGSVFMHLVCGSIMSTSGLCKCYLFVSEWICSKVNGSVSSVYHMDIVCGFVGFVVWLRVNLFCSVNSVLWVWSMWFGVVLSRCSEGIVLSSSVKSVASTRSSSKYLFCLFQIWCGSAGLFCLIWVDMVQCIVLFLFIQSEWISSTWFPQHHGEFHVRPAFPA